MNRMQLRGWRRGMEVLLLSALVSLGGCGGGSSNPNADPSGYYSATGTATVKQSDNKTDLNITDLEAMATGSHVMMLSVSNGLLYDINITTVSGSSFTGEATIYADNGTSQSISSAGVSGTITAGSSITGTLSGTGPGNGSFSLNYSNQTGTLPTSADWLSQFAGSSKLFVLGLTNSTTLTTVATVPDGYFGGCSIAGTVTPQGTNGLYQVSATVTGCTVDTNFNGNYSGLAAPRDANAIGLTLAITKSDGSHAISADFQMPALL